MYKNFKDQLLAEKVPTEYLNLYKEGADRSAFFQTAYLKKYGGIGNIDEKTMERLLELHKKV